MPQLLMILDDTVVYQGQLIARRVRVGAHYQKAIQSASQIRGNVKQNIKVRYAYYASDNPLETGSTLASGGLGASGVKPTYLITQKILEQIF